MKNNPAIILRPGREQSVLRRHPWVFSGAVNMVEGEPADGQTFDVYDSKTNWLARGSYSSKSQITVRLLTFDPDEVIDESFWDRKIRDAISFRRNLDLIKTNSAIRLIHAESDGMPGVVADRYGDFVVCQFSSAGAEYWKDVIVRQIKAHWPCEGVFERSDTDSRTKEGLPPSTGVLSGKAPPALIRIQEHGLSFNVDVLKGHKTGFYLDQSINRQKIMAFCKGATVLNAFSYTGGFGVAAAVAGAATVTHVDASEDVLQMARENHQLNPAGGTEEFICRDVFQLLRTYRDSRQQFDVIILDPPKFVSSAGQLNGGARGYKDINLLAFKLLKPGGTLVTFSCSGYVKPELFQKIVADAAIDAGRHARIMDFLNQSPDHPVALSFPEGLYLKGLICRVD